MCFLEFTANFNLFICIFLFLLMVHHVDVFSGPPGILGPPGAPGPMCGFLNPGLTGDRGPTGFPGHPGNPGLYILTKMYILWSTV